MISLQLLLPSFCKSSMTQQKLGSKKSKYVATTVDAMEPFVKATYKLEGDGPLSLEAYQQLSILLPPCLPNITKMLLLWQRLKQMEMLHMSNNSSLTIQRHVYSPHMIVST